ncbi:MAG TPA: hypothetical protein VNW99_11575 [Cytophagaceae bacterium]|jgi:hypothetical protein|nr:hypothetical protein [Cytophagaceae bacterium]
MRKNLLFNFQRVFDYAVLSCLLGVIFSYYGDVFSTATMLIFYATAYAVFLD